MVARISRRHVCHLCRRTIPMPYRFVACSLFAAKNIRSNLARNVAALLLSTLLRVVLFFVFALIHVNFAFYLSFHLSIFPSFHLSIFPSFHHVPFLPSLHTSFTFLSFAFLLSCFPYLPTFLPSYLITYLLISDINNIYI